MRLLFDIVATQPNGSVKRHGGGKYGEIILFRLIERQINFWAVYDSRMWLNPKVLAACEKANIPLIDVAGKNIDDIVNAYHIDVMYSCLPEIFSSLTACKMIGTIHGLRLIETPFDFITEFHRNGKCFPRLLKSVKNEINGMRREKARKEFKRIFDKTNFEFVTVSNHSKYSILSQFPQLKESQIKVFYSPSTASSINVLKKNIEQKYFLMVSANRLEKNVIRGIIALDQMFTEGKLTDYKVFVTGYIRSQRKWWKKLLRPDGDFLWYKIKNKEKFIIKDYVSEEELSSLYANAYALLYPSLNEGFGYPPLEAMRYGVPVVASAIASIPEICGDSALYFMPLSIEEIKNRLLMIDQSSTHEYYRKKSLERFEFIKRKQDQDLERLIDYITNGQQTFYKT